MAINTGVNISKAVAFGVLAPMDGANLTKAVAFGVLAPMDGANLTKAVAFGVLASVDAPVWPAFSFGLGTLGIRYSQSFSFLRGTPPIAVSLVPGALLPDGLSLVDTGVNGASVTGTCTAVGTYTFALSAANAYGTVDQTFSITVVGGAGGGSFTWIM